jgi:selenocysteine lyase/cysteine desulfurase
MISPRPLSSEPRAEADERYFEALRRAEFAQLDRHGLAYLDYAGAALVARSQIEAHDRLLRDQPLGNPHSEHRPSRAATEAIEAARRKTLAFLGVDESTHVAIFTANASAALRLVGESYPFGGARGLVLTADNHNSVNGLREPARRARSPVAILPVDTKLRLESPEARLAELARSTHGLFALPAQSNFSGVRHSSTRCSTPPPSSRPPGSTSPRFRPTSWCFRSTRSSVSPPASERSSRGARRSTG